MACNFIKVGSAATCEENYSGVGAKFYIFTTDTGVNPTHKALSLDTAPEFSTDSFIPSQFKTVRVKTQSGKVTSSSNPNGGGFNNVYTCIVPKDMEKMSDVMRIMNNTTGWGIAVPTGKKKTVNLDKYISATAYNALTTQAQGSYTLMESGSHSGEYKLTSTPETSLDEFIVLYSNDYDIEFSVESDTGDTPDSDHGHTLTITQSNMIYALQKWYGPIADIPTTE